MKLLSKYPVTTPNGEYRVLIYKIYAGLGTYDIKAIVQIAHKSLFSKFKTVHIISFDENDFMKIFMYDFISFAKEAIEKYENKIKDKIREKKMIYNNLMAWENWDGVIK